MQQRPKIPRNWPDEWEQGFIKTSNKMGIMTVELSDASLDFIELAKQAKKPVVDIGAAFGAVTYGALEAGASVVAIDLGQNHIDILESNVPKEYDNKLTTQCASFPDEVEFNDESISAILISQVLHFFDGETVMRSLEKCYRWLEPGGKIFIVVMTPNLSFFTHYKDEFILRQQAGEQWPGIFNPREAAFDEWKDQLPELVHLFEKPIIQRACEQAGFQVEKNEYFSFATVAKRHLNDEGHEWIVVTAVKT